MAESSGHSTSRKRKATAAASSPIIQLSSAGFCDCTECWKTAVLRPLARRSPRLAAKQRRLTTEPMKPQDHERHYSKNSFVYESHMDLEGYVWSTHGRYLYKFSKKLDLMIVDLLRKTYKLLEPRTEWYRSPEVMELMFVSPYAILVSIYIADGDRDELHLLRLTKEGDDYERILLHRTYNSDLSAFALVELTGQGVDVKRTVVHCGSDGRIIFLMVDIDEPRAVVVDNAVHPFRQTEEREFVADLSADGRELLAIHDKTPKVLQIYSLAERKWTKRVLQGLDVGPDPYIWYRFSPSGQIYVQGGEIDGPEFFYRCDVEQKKWERVPLECRDMDDIAFVVNPADGREDGLLICRSNDEEEPQRVRDKTVQRFKIERRMFRNPDSLLRQSFVAVQKLHEGVHVEEVIRELRDAAGLPVPQKKFFPSAYDGMTPIPVRFHQ